MTSNFRTMVETTASAVDQRGTAAYYIENAATVVFTVPTSGTVDIYTVNGDGTYTLLGTCAAAAPALRVEGPLTLTVNKSASVASSVELWSL